MKKLTFVILSLLLIIITSACANTSTTVNSTGTKEIKLGISGPDQRVWDYVAEKAKKEGIDVKIIRFSDYVQPNLALAEGDIDANAFQTYSYFQSFTSEHHLSLTPLATTVLAPMGIYSDHYQNVADIPEGAEIAIPNDVSNMNRALLLLEEAGLIKLSPNFNGTAGLEGIIENPKNLKITPLVAGQTPRVLPDVAASIINNGFAVDAGFSPTEDSIFHESATAIPYVNIIAVRAGDENREELIRVAQLYQEDDVAQLILEEFAGNLIPTFIPLDQLQ